MAAAVAAVVHGQADLKEAEQIMAVERGKDLRLLP
jgi:hypothetical protein